MASLARTRSDTRRRKAGVVSSDSSVRIWRFRRCSRSAISAVTSSTGQAPVPSDPAPAPQSGCGASTPPARGPNTAWARKPRTARLWFSLWGAKRSGRIRRHAGTRGLARRECPGAAFGPDFEARRALVVVPFPQIKSTMRFFLLVMVDLGTKHLRKVAATADRNPVRALPYSREHPSLREGLALVTGLVSSGSSPVGSKKTSSKEPQNLASRS